MAIGWWPERRDLLSEFLRVQREMDRLFGTAFGQQRQHAYPAVNVYDDGERFRVRAELPGARRETLDVSATSDTLTLGGERAVEPPGNASVHRREREAIRFKRSLSLPEPIDPAKVQASYSDGVLVVTLPRAEEARPRKIQVG